MAYGITATGFAKKTLAVVKSEWETAIQAAFGKAMNLQPPSLAATIIGIASDREASVWDIAEESWNARGASTSQGVSLDNVGELTAEERIAPQPSQTFDQIFFGDVGTLVDTTFIAAVNGNASGLFSPLNSVTLAAGTNSVQKLSFSATPDAGTWTVTMPDGQTTAALAFNAIASAVQTAVRLLTGWDGVTVSGSYVSGFTFTFTDGSVVGYAGVQPQPAIIGNSSVTHTSTAVTITQSHTTVGVAQAVAAMVAKSDGPTVALAGTLSVINTPVTGLRATKNLDDATVGRLVETDAEYRIRRESDLQSSSSATLEAIRIRLKKVLNVTEAIVYENTTLITDGNGVPGKAIHAYVAGGTDQDVANALWIAVGGGIQTYGSVIKTVVDSQGLSQTVSFDRPTLKPVYGIYTITPNADYPANGDALVLAAILAYAETLKIGDDVLLRPKLLPAIADAIPGIDDIVITIGFSPTPVGTSNLAIAVNELATFASGNQTVSS